MLAAPDYVAAGVQYGLVDPRLGGDWIVAGSRVMSVTIKVGVRENFKTLVTFGIQCDSLSPRGLELINQEDYHVSV